jgi:hypothetical protein
VWLWDKSLNVLEWPIQSPDLNPNERLWKDLKIAVQRLSLFNLTELERICREEWEKLPKYRCAKLVASYPRRLNALNRCQRCFNKVLSKGSEYLCKCDTNLSTNLFLLCHYGEWCVNWWGEKTIESIVE